MYGNGYMGVTEANYAVVLVHLITGIIAPFRWLYHPFAALARSSLASQLLPPAAADFLATVQLNDFAVVWISSMAASLLVQQVVRVFRLSGSPVLEHTTLPIKERGHKQLGKWRAAWHLLQLLSFFVLGGVLVTLPGFAPGQGRVAFATFGVAYAMQVGHACCMCTRACGSVWLCVCVRIAWHAAEFVARSAHTALQLTCPCRQQPHCWPLCLGLHAPFFTALMCWLGLPVCRSLTPGPAFCYRLSFASAPVWAPV